MKNDKEILEAWDGGDTESLSISELQRLRALKELGYGRPLTAPTAKLRTDWPESTGKNELSGWFGKFVKNSGHEYVDYERIDTWEFSNSDSGCDTDVSSWSPADTYVSAIWHSVYCEAALMKICVPGIDINAGDGLSVQIRTIGKFDAPTEADACECVSCASNTLSTYTLTIKQYGMVTEICELDVFDVGEAYRSSMIKAMGKRWAEFFDATIYSELETATPGNTQVLAAALSCSAGMAGSCCTDTDLVNLYNAIVDLEAAMRESAYNPDYMIVSPSVARILKSMQTPSVLPWAASELEFKNGKMVRFGGLKVIEYCGANSCTDLSGQEVAIVIDSSRAVGSAFGKRPQLFQERNIDCNSTTVAMWAFWACAELDTEAIGHIVNP